MDTININFDMSQKFVKLRVDYWDYLRPEYKNLVCRCNERMKIGRVMPEEVFREVWQKGLYYHLNACSTNEKYCQFVHDYVEKYGKPLEKDTVMYRAVNPNEEDKSNMSGGSWTKDFKSAFEYSARFGKIQVYSMTIPKGTKVIHFHGTLVFPESEDLIDTVNVKNDSLKLYATLKKLVPINSKKVTAFYEKADGCLMPHILSNKYSRELIGMFLNDVA